MKKAILATFILMLCGCTIHYKAEPNPMKADMVEPFHSDSSIRIINSQTLENGLYEIENTGAAHILINLNEATDSTISLLKEELEKDGVKSSDSSEKALMLSLEKLYMGNYFAAVGCTATLLLETNSGVSKRIKTHNVSGLSIMSACNFAMTKIVAEIMNDQEIRSFIDSALSENNSMNKRLIELN